VNATPFEVGPDQVVGLRLTPRPVSESTFENFIRAETDHMMTEFVAEAGGVNAWTHNRAPTPLDNQTVVRMNRAALYSEEASDDDRRR
jgi:hypothetical protein